MNRNNELNRPNANTDTTGSLNPEKIPPTSTPPPLHDSDKKTSFKIFDRIYKRYDLLNRILSLGLDIFWRFKLSKRISKAPNQLLLDLATGTGDVSFCLLKHCPQIKTAVGCDTSFNMLERAKLKSAHKKFDHRCTFIQGDAACSPFPPNSFNAATMAFGIRNVPNPSEVLSEIRRVLKPNGSVLILEFSLATNKFIKKLHLLYLRYFVPFTGALISGDLHAYRYLNQTIETFPYGEAFCNLMREAGFKNVSYTPLTFGAVTIYEGHKIENEDI